MPPLIGLKAQVQTSRHLHSLQPEPLPNLRNPLSNSSVATAAKFSFVTPMASSVTSAAIPASSPSIAPFHSPFNRRSQLLLKLEELCGASVRHLHCQLPSEDLDALVSITSDEDLTKPHRGIRSRFIAEIIHFKYLICRTYHRHDAARAENALTLLYGNEPIGMQRDWNEELQSCREFPRTSPQKRILRDRALYKVTSDFVDAAINGAIGVISGCIPPINPTDPECFHMYVHNNIFFSFAIDADLEKLSKKLVDANSKSWSSNSLQSSSDKDSIPVHGESQVPNGGKDDGSIHKYIFNIFYKCSFLYSQVSTYGFYALILQCKLIKRLSMKNK
ncbi:hypothetical protein JHK82_015887 [Glycine max]|nr:hypothetical protein JHK85_016291 [Glycine max]KAG5046507.1 hypothetical protein JHK86_015913 [Glycine max]KAG5149006.1 hypothetical protein JHK82_015887 [Glycine max]